MNSIDLTGVEVPLRKEPFLLRLLEKVQKYKTITIVTYTFSFESFLILKALADTGIKITIFSDKFDVDGKIHKNITLHRIPFMHAKLYFFDDVGWAASTNLVNDSLHNFAIKLTKSQVKKARLWLTHVINKQQDPETLFL